MAGAWGALALGLAALGDTAAEGGMLAGASAVEVSLPEGTPLGGYGGFPRRAWLPDVLGRAPHALWFRPAAGVHDPVKVRALVLESGARRVLWLAVDLVAVDPGLVADLRARLGGGDAAVVVSASHTHSGPGAYADSELFAVVALDRRSAAVRAALLDALERAAREAERRRGPALIGTGRAEVRGVAVSRLQAPLDPELGVLKIVRPDGRPVGLVWNYAIHGTALGRRNFLLSGDLMAEASTRIEARIEAPALFVNGAVGDVSPRRHGWEGVRLAGAALAEAALGAWDATAAGPDARLEAVTGRVRLPAPALSARNCAGAWVPAWVRLGLRGALPTEAELAAVRIGGSGWVTIPGELESRLGLELKASGGPAFAQVFVAGLSNDYLGYFLTAEAYGRPSYIACGSLYGERGGEMVRDAARGLLGRLAGGLEAGSAGRRTP